MKTLKPFLLICFLFVSINFSFSQSATLTVCENTDDSVNPINPTTTVKVGQPVVYQIAFEKPFKEGKKDDQFFIAWEVYKVDDDGKDVQNLTELMMTVNGGYRRYAITDFQYFNEPGKYRVYALAWEKRDINFKNGNYKDYFGKTEITVTE